MCVRVFAYKAVGSHAGAGGPGQCAQEGSFDNVLGDKVCVCLCARVYVTMCVQCFWAGGCGRVDVWGRMMCVRIQVTRQHTRASTWPSTRL